LFSHSPSNTYSILDEDARKIKIFNYASQVYNHGVYVSSLVPFGHAKSDWMTKKLSLHFGSVDQFERVFVMV
jgi:superoxide dismutase